ncbi:hypothetical protein ACIBMZ_26580 [Micromonospora sp. NPDC049900]|uniref:hypothetical protein n=1 Tax=Micromonospora sp. NPDC049900 TaxID=3364275 RepID=UPI00378FED54
MEERHGAGTRRQHRAHQQPGRPHRVYLRLSGQELSLLEVAAAEAGLTVAGFAAKAAIAAASGENGRGTSGDLRELQRELFAARRSVTLFGSNVNQAAAGWNSTGKVPGWAAEAVRMCARAVDRLDEVTARIHRRLR